MTGMHIEETRAIGYDKFWKISFVLYSAQNYRQQSEELRMRFFDKWTNSPVGHFPYKITSGNVLRISFSDKSIPEIKKYNSNTKQYESNKTFMTQKDVDEYKSWFFDLFKNDLGMEI